MRVRPPQSCLSTKQRIQSTVIWERGLHSPVCPLKSEYKVLSYESEASTVLSVKLKSEYKVMGYESEDQFNGLLCPYDKKPPGHWGPGLFVHLFIVKVFVPLAGLPPLGFICPKFLKKATRKWFLCSKFFLKSGPDCPPFWVAMSPFRWTFLYF